MILQSPKWSIIIPTYNEESQITSTVDHVFRAVNRLDGVESSDVYMGGGSAEVLVVDNGSTDRTLLNLYSHVANRGMKVIRCQHSRAPAARNCGAAHARGDILVFVDADTWIPERALVRIQDLVIAGHEAGIFGLTGQERTFRSLCWWAFWNTVRMLPMAKVKALPAFMFCTREVFDRYGPFDEGVLLGEEWPILCGIYRREPQKFVYDVALKAQTSCRRMEMQPLGYTRTMLKYIWAFMHRSGRLCYTSSIRERPPHARDNSKPSDKEELDELPV
jgi:glycosyltransferase involved in cell wall biosynthesis